MSFETDLEAQYPLKRKCILAAMEYLDGKDNPLELWLAFTEDSPLNAIFTEGKPNKTDGIFALGPRTRKDFVVVEGDHLVVTRPETGVSHTVPFFSIACLAVRGEHKIDGYYTSPDASGNAMTYVPFYTVAPNKASA